VLSLEAVGFADVAASVPMRSDCLFWIASQSKPITATALMMLVDEGRISVDDPVEKYLPEFKGQMVAAERDADHVLLRKPRHPILVRNILSHTSGLAFRSPIETPALDLFPLATRVRSYAMMPLEFEPDTKYQYSNEGINTAGRIIEVVSGMPYERFLDERLFKPLGMRDTTFWPSGEQLRRLAKSYKLNAAKTGLEETRIDQLTYPLDDRQQRQPMPAGGLFSTATDLSLFYRMLLNGGTLDGKRYVTEQSLQQMTHKQTGDLKDAYGFGFSTGGGRIGHGGAYSTDSSIDVEHQLIEIFLVQHASWPEEGKQILPAFRKAAVDAFARDPAKPAAWVSVTRLPDNPILRPEMMPKDDGKWSGDLNFPSLIRVPDWIEHPLGKYYLYFSAHHGSYVRLAFADRIEGPWKIYEPGALRLAQVEAVNGAAAEAGAAAETMERHVASPDVHVDDEHRQIRMYFHYLLPKLGHSSTVAISNDGLHFEARPGRIAGAYLRVVRHGGGFLAIDDRGSLLRSPDGLARFEPVSQAVARVAADPARKASFRHGGLLLDGDVLRVFFTRIGDAPEQILLTQVNLSGDATTWQATPPLAVLEPQRDYEGVGAELLPSTFKGETNVRQLRDPSPFRDADGRTYLFYAVAGETGIAVASMRLEP
jgi:CubicO group peptidase (beta-lactamase class C family)